MFFESFECTDSDTFSMTHWAFIEVFSHFFSDFLWLELDRIHRFPAVTTKKSDISAFWIEVIFSFFSERGDVHEICVRSRHTIINDLIDQLRIRKYYRKRREMQEFAQSFLNRAKDHSCEPYIQYFSRPKVFKSLGGEKTRSLSPDFLLLSSDSNSFLPRTPFEFTGFHRENRRDE